jgi:hypothetical protein
MVGTHYFKMVGTRRGGPIQGCDTYHHAAANGRPGHVQATNATRDAAGCVCATVRAPRGRDVFPVLRAPFPGEAGFGAVPARAYLPRVFELAGPPDAAAVAAGFESAFRRAVAAGLGTLADDVAVD